MARAICSRQSRSERKCWPRRWRAIEREVYQEAEWGWPRTGSENFEAIFSAFSCGGVLVLSRIRWGSGSLGESKTPSAFSWRKSSRETSFLCFLRSGVSMRRSSSSGSQVTSMNSTWPSNEVIVRIMFSIKLCWTEFSGLKVKISAGIGIAAASSKTESQIDSRSSTKGGLANSKTDSRRSTAR